MIVNAGLNGYALYAARRHTAGIGVQVMREAVEFFRYLPHQPAQHVVRKHGRNGYDQPNAVMISASPTGPATFSIIA